MYLNYNGNKAGTGETRSVQLNQQVARVGGKTLRHECNEDSMLPVCREM